MKKFGKKVQAQKRAEKAAIIGVMTLHTGVSEDPGGFRGSRGKISGYNRVSAQYHYHSEGV